MQIRWLILTAFFFIVVRCNPVAVPNRILTSSRTMPPVAGHTFDANNLIDGNTDTCWQEAEAGDGEGQWIEFEFLSPQNVKSLSIAIGMQSSDQRYGGDLFLMNPRPQDVKICSGSLCKNVRLADIKGFQDVELGFNSSKKIKLTILSVYRGSRWHDAAISEVTVNTDDRPTWVYIILLVGMISAAGILIKFKWIKGKFRKFNNHFGYPPDIIAEPITEPPLTPLDDSKPDDGDPLFTAAEISKMDSLLRRLGTLFRYSLKITGGILLLGILLIIFFATGYADRTLNFFRPPEPVFVSRRADDFSTRLFEYSTRVFADVRNDGGPGVVIFEATVSQGKNHWTKTATKRVEHKETVKFELIFDEVSMDGGTINYSVDVYSGGK